MSFDPEKITFFAKTDARSQQVPFGIKAKDRQRHMYIVGKTGMGKSTLLENMAVQDIQNGEGMAFIDPHGSAAETLLDYIPEHRLNDVVYFAPFDTGNPISFNVMEDVDPDKRHLVVSGLMSTFKKIWVDAWSARMEYILTNALLAIIEYPDTTLLSVNRLFSDKVFRKQVVDYIKDPAVKAFWVDEFANYTDRFAAEALPAIQNKIGQFTGNPLIRNIIGQPHSSFDIRKIMDERKILIMNLSKGLIGETNANLLGSMLTTRIYLAAMSRADLPVAQMKKMPNFYFYVDEFQSFANATFANILSEARKYHLNLIIAHQYIAQMEEEVRDAVFGNVGTTVAFRVGPFDAEVLETVFTPRFLAADLVNLGFAQIYLTLMIDGIGSQPFSALTLPPIAPPSISCKDMVIAASRRNYTKSREVVEKMVIDVHQAVKEDKTKTEKSNQQQAADRIKSNGSNGDKSNFEERKVASPPKITKKVETEPRASVNRNAAATPTMPLVSSPKPISKEPIEIKTVSEVRRHTVEAKSPSDLKAILSQISAAEKKGPEPMKKSTNSVTLKNQAPAEDLRSALAAILKQAETIAPDTKTTIKESSVDIKTKSVTVKQEPINQNRTPRSAPAPSSSPAPHHPTTPPTTQPHKPEERLELERLAAEAEEAFVLLETNHAAANSSSVADDPLAPKKLERLFRQAKDERSPFAS
ncbi:MAG TPA: type IV secretion system DNA-binding domain-containing protein [Candidatus Paceibacterota bacterium]|nr:type IV secretion system DNA-binding domain-containing protein [Candidatus Paceibacterota bacterium]